MNPVLGGYSSLLPANNHLQPWVRVGGPPGSDDIWLRTVLQQSFSNTEYIINLLSLSLPTHTVYIYIYVRRMINISQSHRDPCGHTHTRVQHAGLSPAFVQLAFCFARGLGTAVAPPASSQAPRGPCSWPSRRRDWSWRVPATLSTSAALQPLAGHGRVLRELQVREWA
jgi:hypothetical protein